MSKPSHNSVQYWDASAILALIFQEPHTSAARKAHIATDKNYSWNWMEMEAHGAVMRRTAAPEDLKLLNHYLSFFDFLGIEPQAGHHAMVRKLLDKHRLRAADAGHLFCLLQLRKVQPDVTFVCFDKELVRAAKKEGIRVFGEN